MITKIKKGHLITLSLIICQLSFSGVLTSCSDLMDTDSELKEYEEDNTLQQATDSVYSVMGIIHKMQVVADRTVLLGELRGDLTAVTTAATKDMKAVANFEVNTQNAYNRISDYYAIINNCNYFLAHINLNIVKNNRNVFEGEYAAVKAFRAWTYLQLAQIYGSVPLVTDPLLTEEAAQNALKQTPENITAICNYFISDLKPYVDVKLPNYQTMDTDDSRKFFIPVRVILGDLCLWAGRYNEAAQYYHDYLSLRTAPVRTGTASARWYDAATKEFRMLSYSLSYSSGSDECICFIPMEYQEFYGVRTELNDIFNSTILNMRYAKVEPSKRLRELSAASNYCVSYTKVDQSIDTIYAPKVNLDRSEYVGDLRLAANYHLTETSEPRFSRISSKFQSILKYSTLDDVVLYRTNMVYLRYAEALNRAGYPQSAFAVLKYGLYPDMVAQHVDSLERKAAGTLIDFDVDLFTVENTQGVHARGSGDAQCDTLYVLPQPATALGSRQDTIDYQVPLVEDMIINEMALEGAFEGNRYYDLMRVALRRGDNAYLADAVARRGGTLDAALQSKLMNRDNWYLPKP